MLNAILKDWQGAYAATLDCVGQAMSVRACSIAPIDFIQSTFYPPGAFNVRLLPSQPSGPDAAWQLYDMELPPDTLAKILREIGSLQPFRTFVPVSKYPQPAYRVGDWEVYLDGLRPADPALICRRGTTFMVLSGSGEGQKRWLTRLVRHIAARRMENTGAIGFHAACFEFGGKAYLAIGDSGAGKSTLAAAFARYAAGAWICNDKTYVDTRDPNLLCLGYPGVMAVNKGSLLALGLDRDYKDWTLLADKPSETTDWASYDGDTKLKLSPREVETVLSMRIARRAPLGGLIFPQVRQGVSGAHIQRRAIDECMEVLKRNSLIPGKPEAEEDWLSIRDPSIEQGERRFDIFIRLTEDYPVWSCQTGSYDDTAEVVRKLAADFSKYTPRA